MVKPLTFKGDKAPKKKRKRAASPSTALVPSSSTTTTAATTTTTTGADAVDDDDTWVSADAPSDLAGPVLVALPSDPPSSIACDAAGTVFALRLENMVEGDIGTAEPHDVRQVWVANRVAGMEGVTLKGHHGRYLTVDKFGLLSATREAISAEEQFVAIPTPEIPGAFSLQTQRDRFLSVADAPADSNKPPVVRGDAESVSFSTTFRIRMQARFKPRLKASKEKSAREKISRRELEDAVGRRLEEDEVKRLKRARRDGNYHEAILDVRVSGKHDKFAS